MRSILLLLAAALLVAADDSKRDEKATSDLRGIWEGKSAVTAGKESTITSTWEIKEDKIVVTQKDRTTEWKYRSEAKKNPMEIDLTPGDGSFAGKTLKGIYKIEKDTLTICYVRAEKGDRPAEFDTKKRDDVVILTFERKKP